MLCSRRGIGLDPHGNRANTANVGKGAQIDISGSAIEVKRIANLAAACPGSRDGTLCRTDRILRYRTGPFIKGPVMDKAGFHGCKTGQWNNCQYKCKENIEIHFHYVAPYKFYSENLEYFFARLIESFPFRCNVSSRQSTKTGHPCCC